ncbi:MAG: hypothetical protein ABIL74_08830 [candidate division WOR-3 bacterium]
MKEKIYKFITKSRFIKLYSLIMLICYCHRDETSLRYDTNPAWSPDGNYIAFCRMIKEDLLDTLKPDELDYSILGDVGIKLLDLNTGKEQILVHTFSELDWTKDSRWIIYEGIYKVDAKNGKIMRILIDTFSFYPVVSPDGSRILYCSTPPDSITPAGSGIYLTDINGSYRKYLVCGLYPDWHPSGDRFLFCNGFNLCIADTNGNIIKTIIENKNIRSPRFSPDGSKIIYCDGYTEGENEKDAYIYLIDTLVVEQKIITQGIEPCWSPDGKEIVFSGYDDTNGGMVLWIMDIDGNNIKKDHRPGLKKCFAFL